MSTSQLLITSLASSAFGFGAGWFAARVGRDVTEHHGIQGSTWFERARTLLGLLILVMVFYSVYTINRVTYCQAKFNESFIAGLAERTAAADAERQANRIRWTFLAEALRNPILNPTPEQQREAAHRWLKDLERADQLVAEADAKRAANPVQQPSKCGLISDD